TWQYVLNRASENKDAAKRFLNYVAGRGGSRLYAETLKYLPAREDLIWQEKLDIDGFEQIRDFLRTVRLQARPLPENSMEYISKEGQLFQLYVMGEISLDNYCDGMQRLVDEAWGR
ncbi:MAG: ABC transporter substrate-binding protein, partial [Clostridiales bacterium]|nr:ABC transporter substrate-binding protein [Clostridiales bacterium]